MNGKQKHTERSTSTSIHVDRTWTQSGDWKFLPFAVTFYSSFSGKIFSILFPTRSSPSFTQWKKYIRKQITISPPSATWTRCSSQRSDRKYSYTAQKPGKIHHKFSPGDAACEEDVYRWHNRKENKMTQTSAYTLTVRTQSTHTKLIKRRENEENISLNKHVEDDSCCCRDSMYVVLCLRTKLHDCIRKELYTKRYTIAQRNRRIYTAHVMSHEHQKLSQFMSGVSGRDLTRLTAKSRPRRKQIRDSDDDWRVYREWAEEPDRRIKAQDKKRETAQKWNAAVNIVASKTTCILTSSTTTTTTSSIGWAEYINVMSIYAWIQEPSIAILMNWRHRNLSLQLCSSVSDAHKTKR